MFNLTNRDYAHFYFDDYDLDAQLVAIRAALALARAAEAKRTEEIEALTRHAEETGSNHLADARADELNASVYDDAARSAAAVGMLAPFLENLFVGIFRGIGKMGKDVLGHETRSDRSLRAIGLFWDPHLYYAKDEIREDLPAGIMQLAEAAALLPFFPADLKPALDALFGYRNMMLHNGFEWPPEKRASFGNRVKQWPSDWFGCATTNHKPWVWYMTDKFIERVLTLIDQVLEATGQHTRLYYERED
jgi:hypothetical protein